MIGQRWAFIDWDGAGPLTPGTRLWDLAYAVHGFIPMSASPEFKRRDAGSRLRIFADAYGLDESQRRALVPLLAKRAQSMRDFLAEQAAVGTQPWTSLWQAGHGDAWQADADYLRQHQQRWAADLLS